MKMLRDPLFWLIALFVALLFWLPYSQPLFAALFPATATTRLSAGKLCCSGTGSFLAGGEFRVCLRLIIGGRGRRNCCHSPVGRGISPTGGNYCRRWADFSARRGAGDCRSGDRLWSGNPRLSRLILYGVLARPAGRHLPGLGAIDCPA